MCCTIANFPVVEFKLGRRKRTGTTRNWLYRKKEYFSKMWKKDGSRLLRSIEKNCGMSFPNKARGEGIRVYFYKQRRDDPVRDMEVNEPLRLNLYLQKSDTWIGIKRVLIRGLLRSLIWQKYCFEFRIKEPTIFEDILAEELVTSIVECRVLRRKPTKKTCTEALNYAINETIHRLSRSNPQKKLIDTMFEFFEGYKHRIKNKEYNILKEKQILLTKLLKLLPETFDSDYFLYYLEE